MKSLQADENAPVVALIRSRQHLQADPENTTALFEQATALYQLGQWEPALASWEQVTRLEPGNAYAHLNRGIVHLQHEQWEQAQQAFEAALRCAPENAEAHFGLGVAFAQQERYDLAHAAWQDALHFNPTHPEAHANLAMLTQMSTTEVESVNFGSAHTMRFDCVAPSAAVSELPVWEETYSDASIMAADGSAGHFHGLLESGTAVVASPADAPYKEAIISVPLRQEPSPSQERRIKLPPLIGPPLGAIADTVVAAQEAKAQEPDAVREVAGADFAHAEEPRDPTLRLDSKALKREHARLEAANSSSRQGSAPGWLRSLGVIGSIVALTVALTLWGVERFRPPAVPVSTAALTPLTPPITSASLVTPSAASSTSMRSSVVVEPDTPVSTKASAVHASISHAVKHKVVHDAPVTHRQTDTKSVRRLVVEETPRASRSHSEPSDAAADHPMPSRPATRTHLRRTDEDTFAARHRSGHADNAEEWTDHIP